LNNANFLSLLNQLNPMQNPVNLFSTLTTDMKNLNLWNASPPNFNGIGNLLNQNVPRNDLATNLLGMCASNSLPFPQNTSSLPSILPNSQNFLQEQTVNLPTNFENLSNNKNETKRQQENKMNTEEKDPITHNFIEKPLDQLQISEHQPNTLQYAVVDTLTNHIYFMNAVTEDNFPPGKSRSGTYNSLDIFGSSPALNSRSWTSPTLNPNQLFNNSILNNPFIGFGNTAISPNLGLLHDSPGLDRVLFGQNFNVERRSAEWTPEQIQNTPLTILNSRSRMINQMDKDKGTAPLGNSGSGFSKRASLTDRSKNNSFSTNESSKFDSPSSFLESSQARGLNLKSGDPAKVPVRQIM
jgi:hypothetical protein